MACRTTRKRCNGKHKEMDLMDVRSDAAAFSPFSLSTGCPLFTCMGMVVDGVLEVSFSTSLSGVWTQLIGAWRMELLTWISLSFNYYYTSSLDTDWTCEREREGERERERDQPLADNSIPNSFLFFIRLFFWVCYYCL